MTLLLDAGALIAVEKRNRFVTALIKRERLAGRAPKTHGGVVGQVWRGSPQQANVARLLAGTKVIALNHALGKEAGILLGKTRTKDVVDAALVLLAQDGDEILSSDPKGLAVLAAAAELQVDIVPV